jgi:8-oxo-dGTP pyrophosphatase MutT (NUDIX family)
MHDRILNKLKNSLEDRIGILGKDKYFNSAVLIPVVLIENELHLLFEKRAREIRQGGEVSFPGGEIDRKLDTTSLDTAIRETVEEIGVSKDKIDILGRMDTLVAPMGVTVDPYVGYIRIENLEEIIIDKTEVEKIFTIPLSYFIENKPKEYFVRLEVKPYEKNAKGTIRELLPVKKLQLPGHYAAPWKGKKLRVLVYENIEETIWGITAEIVYELCKRL